MGKEGGGVGGGEGGAFLPGTTVHHLNRAQRSPSTNILILSLMHD